MSRHVDGELWVTLAAVALAIAGWASGGTLLAFAGTLGALGTAMLWVWQRSCLTGVDYTRTLRAHRAQFGDEVALETQLVNDKLLPLSWVHVDDELPRSLTIYGGDGAITRSARGGLQQLLALLPFQRVRRQFTIVCNERGLHRFGAARVRSGDPLGLRERAVYLQRPDHLLVYPKLFALGELPTVLRVPLGTTRATSLIDDPSRIRGVRLYRPGDPMRHVDWRATARGGTLLTREFEATAFPRVAVFVDMSLPRVRVAGVSSDVVEFTIAVGASIVAELSARGVATGLYASGGVEDQPIAREPSSSPAALAAMLELLARAIPSGPVPMAQLLVTEGMRLGHGTTILVVAADFPPALTAAIAAVSRRAPVSAVWSATDQGAPPEAGLVRALGQVGYVDDWRERTSVGTGI